MNAAERRVLLERYREGYRAVEAGVADITKDDSFLPAQELPAAFNPTNLSTLDAALDDAEQASRKCYTRAVTEVASSDDYPDCKDNPATFFEVAYVKFRQPDVSFFQNAGNAAAAPANELNRIPLGHYRIRLRYTPERDKPRKEMVFSRLVTSTITY